MSTKVYIWKKCDYILMIYCLLFRNLKLKLFYYIIGICIQYL